MKNLKLIGKTLAAVAMLGAVALGVSTATARPPCECPDVWMPVICSDGNVYSNYCYAGCAGATGCTPYGDIY